MRLRYCLVIAVLAAGCSKKTDGLPPATQWNAGSAGQAGMIEMADKMPANPHGGAMGGDPNDPHAGVDMSGGGGTEGGDPSDPHGGVDMSGGGGTEGGAPDVSKLGLPPPDPNRVIDPTHRITGTIKADPKVKAGMKDGMAVFLVVKHADASGAPVGTPLAVEKLTWKGDQIPFELTDHDAMIAGTSLAGDVVVVAHYDTDGEAMSKTPGDVLGQVRVTIPADKVTLTLDSLIQ
jgi:hypothetical protein